MRARMQHESETDRFTPKLADSDGGSERRPSFASGASGASGQHGDAPPVLVYKTRKCCACTILCLL